MKSFSGLKPIKLGLALSLICINSSTFADTELSTEQIENAVRKLIEKEPELIAKAKDALKEKKEKELKSKQLDIITSNYKSIYERPGDPVDGNPQGDVTLIMFQDYRCGHCKAAHKILKDFFTKDKNLRLILKEYPILGPDSVYASKASLAAIKQGREKQIKFADAMMNSTDPITKDEILKIAASVGLNVEQLKTDMSSSEIEHMISENHKIARSLDIRGTPTFVVGTKGEEEVITGVLDEGELEDLVKKIRGKRQNT